MNDIINSIVVQPDIIFQLVLASFLGSFIGIEREYKRKEAGMRTYALVCLGAALFTILGFECFRGVFGNLGVSFDPSRIIQAVAMGIGFLGAGLIIIRRSHLEGLTTSAGLWVVAAVGLAIGLKMYFVAVFTSFLAVAILSGLRLFEERFLKTKRNMEENEQKAPFSGKFEEK
jgi:putative Mg2+ transporter-C (MgtC) family protein